MKADAVKTIIRSVFETVEYPGDWCLRGSNEGDEPYQVEEAFKGKNDWKVIDARFLDRAPNGLGSALSFFSDEAFRFYLPAYLIADINGQLERADPLFHLTHGLTDDGKTSLVNPRRYGARTSFDSARYRCSVFDKPQSSAIVAYLEFKRTQDEYSQTEIDQALSNFWRHRLC